MHSRPAIDLRSARRFARALRRRVRPRGAAPVVTARPNRVLGVVEQFGTDEITGWVSVPADAPPVRVTLHVGDLDVATTYATAVPTAQQAADDAADDEPAKPALYEVTGPAKRHGWQQIRPFAFKIDDIWDYTTRGTRLSVHARDSTARTGTARENAGRGGALPITGHGMYLRATRPGGRSMDELREKLGSGYVFSQYGVLQLSKKLDLDWQRRVLALYEQTRHIVAKKYGRDVFLVYGTLLGAVRENGYIAHDIDFDSAFVSDRTEGPGAADQLAQIAATLVEHGLDAQIMYTALHVRDQDDPDVRIDLFHLYFDDTGALCFPFGVAGTTRYTRDDWCGTAEVDFGGGRVLVPVDAEQFVEHQYGASWREAKPGFNWATERTARASAGDIARDARLRSHWTNFYARTAIRDASPFCDELQARPDLPRTVLDIGCGNGRDALAFGRAGHRVVGLDRCELALQHAAVRAAESGSADRVDFHEVDVADDGRLRALLAEIIAAADAGPVLFYLRFFLHAITADTQRSLIAAIGECARPGDLVAAEFRTGKDRNRPKVERNHFRRYQNGPAFGAELRDTHGFALLHEEEGTGLSPYGVEDPELYRVIARRD